MSAAPSSARTLTFDPALACAVVVLALLGAIMVGSASITIADRQTLGAEPLAYLYRHLGALALGGVGMAVAMLLPTELWYRLNWLLLVAALALLVVVLIPSVGHTVNGSRRWILVGPVTVQASEAARLFLLLYIASYRCAVRTSSRRSSWG
jgi:cell division protein FtsW